MKHICVSLGIFLLILAFCLFSANFTSDRVQETSAMLKAALDARRAGDELSSLRLVRTASAHWKKHEAYFGTVLRHAEIDDILGKFARLEAFARGEDQDEFYSTCAALLTQLEHIEQMEWPFAHNIL